MTAVRTNDGRNGILINQRLAGENIPVSGSVLISLCSSGVDREGDLGIRDDLGKEEGMGMATGGAEDPGDPEAEERIPQPEPAGITTVPDEAAGTAAGAGKEG